MTTTDVAARTRLPFAPLEDLVAGGRPRHPARGTCTWCYGRHRVCITVEGIAERLGVTARSIHRWRQTGLDENMADRLAIAAGLHPELVWDDWS